MASEALSLMNAKNLGPRSKDGMRTSLLLDLPLSRAHALAEKRHGGASALSFAASSLAQGQGRT